MANIIDSIVKDAEKRKKPTLRVDRKKFIDWILDNENGSNLNDIAKMIKKKGSVSVYDLLKRTSYLPSELVKSKKLPPDRLINIVYKDRKQTDFEVNPKDFTIVFVG